MAVLSSLSILTWQCMLQKDIQYSERKFGETRYFSSLDFLVHNILVSLTFDTFAL